MIQHKVPQALKIFFSKQFMGFLAAGGLAAFLHWLARIFFSMFMPFSVAVALAYGVGMGVAFLCNSLFVFPASSRPKYLQARDFICTNLLFFPVVWGGTLLFQSMLSAMGWPFFIDGIAHAMAICLPLLFTFVIYKYIAFKEEDHE